MTVALIDGDIVAFRAAAAAQHLIAWDDDTPPEAHADAAGVAEAAIQTIAAWTRLARCSAALVAFTGRSNFRKLILPTYKHNRAGKSKPLAYVYTVNAVRERFPTHLVEGLEADDLLGLMITGDKHRESVCVTVDKDLRGVPGRHLNPLKEPKPVRVSEAQADHKWLSQTITGDGTDGYSGIPKRGPKAAERVLGKPGELAAALWPKVAAEALKAGMTPGALLAQARVARILRSGEFDKETNRVRLWTPPGAGETWIDIVEKAE